MTGQDAKAVAQQLGSFDPTSDRITVEDFKDRSP
jgi:hypothetical protein